MYELMIEDEVSLIQIEAYSEIDKLMLLMSKVFGRCSYFVKKISLCCDFCFRDS